VKIDEKQQVSQPAPFSRGQTAITPSSQIDVEEGQADVAGELEVALEVA
jgi:flagellar P-ring protein precursor FlgI